MNHLSVNHASSAGHVSVALPAPTDRPSSEKNSRPALLGGPSLFIKKPRLTGLSNPKDYVQGLMQHKRERTAKHFNRLLDHLGTENPDPKRLQQTFAKLASAGFSSKAGHVFSVPAGADEQARWLEKAAQAKVGIATALPLIHDPKTKAYLKLVDKLIDQFQHRIAEVNTYQGHKQETLAKLSQGVSPSTADLDADIDINDRREPVSSSKTEKEQWSMAKEGVNGALLRTTTIKQSRRKTLFMGRKPRDVETPTPPKEKAIQKLDSVLKAEPDTTAAHTAMYLYRVMDHLTEKASSALPFGFPQHTVLDLDGAQRHLLAGKIRSIKAETIDTTRQGKLDTLAQAVDDGAIVLQQEALPGNVISQRTLWDRKGVLSNASLAKDIGKSLVLAPMVGLGDHFALNGFGYNSFANAINDGSRLQLFDLSSRPNGFEPGAFKTAAALNKSLTQLAKQMGDNGELPRNWEEIMEPHLSGFLTTAFTLDVGLFSRDDFTRPDEASKLKVLNASLARLKALSQALRSAASGNDPVAARASIDEAIHAIRVSGENIPGDIADVIDTLADTKNPLTQQQFNDLRAQLINAGEPIQNATKAIERTITTRANQELDALKQQAAPHIIAGLVEGVRWVSTNRRELVAAHQQSMSEVEASGGAGGVVGAVSDKDVNRMATLFDKLPLDVGDKLLKAKPVGAVDNQMIPV